MKSETQAPGAEPPEAEKNLLDRSNGKNYKHRASKVKQGVNLPESLSRIRHLDTVNLSSRKSESNGVSDLTPRLVLAPACFSCWSHHGTKSLEVRRYSLPPDQIEKECQLMGGAL